MIGLAAATVVACSPPSDDDSTPAASGSSGAADAKTATSAEAFGGMDALVAAAKKEGALNVIALPPDWANYGEIIKAFQAQVPRASRSPATSPTAAAPTRSPPPHRLKGQAGAPDVFDLGAAVALANTAMFAPYQVATWEDIPATTSRSRPACGSTTTAATWGSATTRPRCPRRPASPTCSSRTTRARSPSTATRPRPARRSPACDGLGRQRRHGRRHHQGRRLLQPAQQGRQLPARRPDPRHDRVRPDPGRHRLGLPQRRRSAPSCRPGR